MRISDWSSDVCSSDLIRALDAFTFGIDSAASLGIAVRRVQVLLIGAAALTTAVMVSIVGSIGFVGLVIPHAMRFIVGVRHRRLVPASALAGAVFLIVSDIIPRVIIPDRRSEERRVGQKCFVRVVNGGPRIIK